MTFIKEIRVMSLTRFHYFKDRMENQRGGKS